MNNYFSILILAVMILTSCISNSIIPSESQSITGNNSNQAPIYTSKYPVKDLPFNGKETFFPQFSSIYSLGGNDNDWVGKLYLQINMGYIEAFNYYKQNMSSFNWQLTASTLNSNSSKAIQHGILLFEQNERIILINIKPTSNALSRSSQVVINSLNKINDTSSQDYYNDNPAQSSKNNNLKTLPQTEVVLP